MVRAYRLYYTTFDEKVHKKIKERLEQELGLMPVEHKSFINEFKYLEFLLTEETGDQQGLEEKIKEIVREMLGKESYIRVDYINV